MEPVSRTPDTSTRLLTVGAMVVLGFLGIGVGLLAVLVSVVALGAAGVSVSDRPLLSIVVSLISIQGVGLSVVGLGYLAVTGRGMGFVRARVPTVRDLLWTIGGFVAILVVLFSVGMAVTAITATTNVETARNSVVDIASQDPTVLLLLIPAAFLVIGPAEELLFRGVIQGRLREVFGPAPAIGIASAIFGFAHVTALTGGSGGVAAILIPLVALSLLSVVFGYAYESTGNLVVPVLIHGAYDALLFGLLYAVFAYSDELDAAANESAALLAALV